MCLGPWLRPRGRPADCLLQAHLQNDVLDRDAGGAEFRGHDRQEPSPKDAIEEHLVAAGGERGGGAADRRDHGRVLLVSLAGSAWSFPHPATPSRS